MAILIELLAMAGVGLLAWLAGDAAVEHAVAKVAGLGGAEVRTAAGAQAEALRATLYFVGGIAALMVGRLVSARRGRVNVPAYAILPATCAAAAMGFALQVGYGDPLHHQFWPGTEFARGFALAGLVGAIVLLLPRDPVTLTAPFHAVLPALIVLAFVALALFGSGTELADDTLINLAGFQPLELVKLVFVIYLGHTLGRRAAKLRHQRDRIFGLDFPRQRLLVPAVGVLLLLFASFVLVNDLGPLLILSLVFLALFYVVTRAGGWVVTAVVVVAVLVAIAVQVPAISGSPKVALRMQMWTDPWTNALPNGDQGALARWAIAAGHVNGQGLGFAPPLALPAGHTDLAIAHLAEELGALGLLLYLACLGAVAGQGLMVALLNRTPERVVTAAGLATLLIAQWLVIFCGTTGLLPLTGVTAPFVSFGKTSMVTFVLVAAILARLAEDGRAREVTSELAELRRGTLGVLTAVVLALGLGVAVAIAEGVVMAGDISTRGVITTLAPEPGYPRGRVIERYDPRLQAIAALIPRGPILDRDNRPVAGVDENGQRTYPLGDAMGTLLGPPDPVVLRPMWMLERLLAARVRGYPERPDGHALWVAREAEGGERLLFVVDSHHERPEDRARAQQMAAGAPVRLLPLPAPDYRPLLPLLRAGGMGREAALARVTADVESRTARITLDARLQAAAAQILRRAAANGKAAAAVVLDANTGEVLARAQWPDFDPGDESFRKRLEDPEFLTRDPKFTGIYGPWLDKTGFRGIYQGGSAAKLFTSLVAARAGVLGAGATCPSRAGPVFGCISRDAQGPLFSRPGWYRAIHDHPLDDPHGRIDFVDGLAVSCNVFFGQLGLQLGADAFKQLVDDGLEMGWGGAWYSPGKPGSRDLALTAFGQHASMMSVSQAGRMVATIGSSGVYRKCPPSMELQAPCERRQILKDARQTAPILAGMQKVMTDGTGRGLAIAPGLPPGVRLYGKTGTADSIGIEEEKYWGVQVGVYGAPHSWFVAVAEPADTPACSPAARKRLALAVVIPRSGLGARFAGPAAAEIVNAAFKLGLLGDPKELAAAAAAAPPSPAPITGERRTAPGAPASPASPAAATGGAPVTSPRPSPSPSPSPPQPPPSQ